jgi:hypothetical protein
MPGAFQSNAFQGFQSGASAPVPTATYTKAGWKEQRRRAYIYKDRKYFLTEYELAVLVAQDLTPRTEVKTVKRGKQKAIPQPVWNAIMASLTKLGDHMKPSIVKIEPYDDSDDEEAIALLLMH